MNAPYIWVDGELVAHDTVHASLLAHGLHYGTGVFEGIRCYPTDRGPAIFRLDAHMARFKAGTEALAMSVNVDDLGRAALELIKKNDHSSAYIRPISYYESGGLALDVAPLKQRSVVATMAWRSHLGDAADHAGVSLRTSPYRRISAKSVPPLKLCGNYVNSILAKLEATRAGYEEALFIDDAGYVCEATGENVFMVTQGKVVAVDHADALPGITRDTVIELTGAETRPVHIDELRVADEIFLTGTSAEVAGVSQLDDRSFDHRPATREISQMYQAVVHGRVPRYLDWLSTP